MGRPLRFKLPGVPQLITQRGHNRLPCFIDGADYTQFQEILSASAALFDCEVNALLMLPHAYWVLATPESETGISRMMQRTGRCYVRYCNGKYRREGTLWASRYHACLVDPSPEYSAQCIAYLQQAPARLGVTAEGQEWPWLSVNSADPKSSAGEALDDNTVGMIEAALNQGLVWGSATFRDEVARSSGIRTEPGRRGRPPGKTKASALAAASVTTP